MDTSEGWSDLFLFGGGREGGSRSKSRSFFFFQGEKAWAAGHKLQNPLRNGGGGGGGVWTLGELEGGGGGDYLKAILTVHTFSLSRQI